MASREKRVRREAPRATGLNVVVFWRLLPTRAPFKGTLCKVGLQISRFDLDEMAGVSIPEPVRELIYRLCSGHIGVASAILYFFRNHGPISNTKLTSIPISTLLTALRGPSEVKLVMVRMLSDVASEKSVRIDDVPRTPEKDAAVYWLTKLGFLYEEGMELHFALTYMDSNLWYDEFLIASLKRMDGRRLRLIAARNPTGYAREKQIHHELYSDVTSCAPSSMFVDPERLTIDGEGYIDIVIQGQSGFTWLWELLVDGDRAVEHSLRFGPGGKYYGDLTINARYALIDFRQAKNVRVAKPNFVYVFLSTDYTKATISRGMKQGELTVELTGRGEGAEDF